MRRYVTAGLHDATERKSATFQTSVYQIVCLEMCDSSFWWWVRWKVWRHATTYDKQSFFLIFSFWALSVLKGGFCSLWTQLLTVASYLMDRRERDIDLLAELSARKRVSVYHKMSNYSFNCCKSDMLQDFWLSRLNFGSLVLGTILSWMIWY